MSVTVPNRSAPAVPEEPELRDAERAAIVLALLDEKGLGSLSGRLSPANKARFAAALERLSAIGPGQQRAVVESFAKQLAAERAGVKGGAAAAARLSGRLYTEDPAPAADPALPERPQTFWEKVEALGAETLAEFLEGCPLPAVATALGALPESFAAEVVGKLPNEAGVGSVVKFAATAAANPLALSAVEQMIGDAFFGAKPTSAPVDTARADRIAGLLNRMTTARREAVLAALPAELDEAMLAAVTERVLGFDDLASRLPRNVVPVIFREADETQLLAALAYAGGRGSKTAEYLFANISQRLAEQLKQRLPADVSEDDGEKAQAGIVGFVLGLVAAGQTSLLDPAAA